VPGLAPNERASRYAPGAEHDQEKARPPHSPSHSWIGVRADGGVLVALLEPLPDCSVEAPCPRCGTNLPADEYARKGEFPKPKCNRTHTYRYEDRRHGIALGHRRRLTPLR